MKHNLAISALVLACGCGLACATIGQSLQGQAPQQVTRADYDRALNLQKEYGKLVLDLPDTPIWLHKGDRFVYRKSVEGGHTFVVYDAATRTKQPAFDHAKLAAALSAASGDHYAALTLPFARFRFLDGESVMAFEAGDSAWKCDMKTWKCEGHPIFSGDNYGYDDTPKAENSTAKTLASPDGKWLAYILNYNVMVRSMDGKQRFTLSEDGSEGNYYAFSTMVWSPDSEHLVAYRIRPGYHRVIQYVESSPKDQLQPESFTMVYPKPGDVLALPQPVLFQVAAHTAIPISNALFPNPYYLTNAVWWKDSRGFTFDYNQRGHQVYRVIEVNAHTGAARTLIDETSKTFINYERLTASQYDTGKIYRHDVNDGKEILWASERDGWEHLYLFNGQTGALENKITSGDWVVRAVNYVDDASRQIWFEASGMNAGEDPYFVHAYRISFDGTGLTPLTPSQANHNVVFSPDGKYYVDTWSRIDLAPTMAVYRTSDNKQLAVVEHADISKLLAAGWRPPTVFHAKGRDGVTDIWGVIYKPAHFNPHGKYRVIEDIYAGPQGSFVPKSFSPRIEPLTQLGFVVSQMDGMGTNNRSRAFHDVTWKNLEDAGFPDRILWHKAAAAEFPWYDISKGVGIFGTSSGGQSSMGALLFHPDFYTVAVSNSGCHDNRMDKIWWNEQWMGWPIGPQYSASSNVDNAWRLKGKLLLIFGEMDHNVDPSSTLQVVDRLIRAHKTFDLLEVPGADHGTRGPYAYYTLRKTYDFFVRNMLGEQPPDWNADPVPDSGK
ncbi:MAG TPA: DPP IV N-terminal domain-containing protein [Terracidiphilus sp.]|nr:DPP IV N-terminal domain-containing protein [Terracidiphilus sp.]